MVVVVFHVGPRIINDKHQCIVFVRYINLLLEKYVKMPIQLSYIDLIQQFDIVLIHGNDSKGSVITERSVVGISSYFNKNEQTK